MRTLGHGESHYRERKPVGQSTEDEPAHRRGLAFMGLAGRCRPAARITGLHVRLALSLFVRHFKEAGPLQTTAMSEVATVLGGLRKCRAGHPEYPRRAQSGNYRHLFDWRYRNEGRRRRWIYQADTCRHS